MTSPSTDRRYSLNSGVALKTPCIAATTAAILLNGTQTIDAIAIVSGDRVLVKDQASGIDNGIYIADTGDWTRDVDFDGTRDCVQGTLVAVLTGTANGGKIFSLTTVDPIIGTSTLAFVEFVGAVTLPVSIANGGTAATTAAGARTSLGAAASGAATTSGITVSSGKILGRTTTGTSSIEELDETLYARTNRVQTFASAQRGTVTGSSATPLTFDMGVTNNFRSTSSTGGTITFSNITSGQSGNILLYNGSNYTMAGSSECKYASGALTALSVTGTYWISYYSASTSEILMSYTGPLST